MSRIRLNQEYRNKIANRMRVHLEQEQTQEKEKFFQEREGFLAKQNATWDLAKECVSRQYPKDDVKMAHYLQDKYPNVNTIAKDSCFHFGYMSKKDGMKLMVMANMQMKIVMMTKMTNMFQNILTLG